MSRPKKLKEKASTVKKELVRNVEKRTSNGIVRSEFQVDPLLALLFENENCMENLNIDPVLGTASGENMKANARKSISTSSKAIVEEKAKKKLNFPFNEAVFQDLISISDTNLNAEEGLKQPARPRRIGKIDPEPKFEDFYKREKKDLFEEFIWDDFSVHVQEIPCRGRRKGEPESGRKMSETERLKQLHLKMGLSPPKLNFYYDGRSLHRRSQMWEQ